MDIELLGDMAPLGVSDCSDVEPLLLIALTPPLARAMAESLAWPKDQTFKKPLRSDELELMEAATGRKASTLTDYVRVLAGSDKGGVLLLPRYFARPLQIAATSQAEHCVTDQTRDAANAVVTVLKPFVEATSETVIAYQVLNDYQTIRTQSALYALYRFALMTVPGASTKVSLYQYVYASSEAYEDDQAAVLQCIMREGSFESDRASN